MVDLGRSAKKYPLFKAGIFFICTFAQCYFPVNRIEPPVLTVTVVPVAAVMLRQEMAVVTTG